jgi:hypothetical protein
MELTGNPAYLIAASSVLEVRTPGVATGARKRRSRDQQLSYKMSYTLAMADTITFRPDEDTSKALEVLTKDGTPVSAVVRTALIDAARRKASAAIRAEAEKLAEDESDRAEAMQVLRDMETLRAW